MIAASIRKIAEYLASVADDIEAGQVVPSDDVRLAARRLLAQAEMMDECE